MQYNQRTVLFANVEVDFDAFESLAKLHLQKNPTTNTVETVARDLIDSQFTEAGCRNFIKEVCRWGGYSGIATRVLGNNSITDIRNAFRMATEQLTIENPDIIIALQIINGLRQLKQTSFASKHLRFLAPKICPVYDSILQHRLPYAANPLGYAAFAGDCIKVGEELTRRKIPNPWTDRNGTWFAADVESCLYTQLLQ